MLVGYVVVVLRGFTYLFGCLSCGLWHRWIILPLSFNKGGNYVQEEESEEEEVRHEDD